VDKVFVSGERLPYRTKLLVWRLCKLGFTKDNTLISGVTDVYFTHKQIFVVFNVYGQSLHKEIYRRKANRAVQYEI
jgi:hypothetical protein